MNQKRRPEKGKGKESKKEREKETKKKNEVIASTISSRSATSSS
jgi:hypothetical protein